MKFYVYVLARPDEPDGSPGAVFYVGKGSGDRIYAHASEARRGHECFKCRIIRKIWRSGGEFQRRVVFRTDIEAEAFACERELIAEYGRDVLANCTDGGEGMANPSASTRAKLGASSRARLARPEEKDRLRQALAARLSDPDSHDRFFARVKQAFEDDPEIYVRRAATLRATMALPEQREHSFRHLARLRQNPEIEARRRENQKRAMATPEFAEVMSRSSKTLWQNPEYRAKMEVLRKAAWARRNDGKSYVCTIDGCDARVRAKGLCSNHYEQARITREGYEPPLHPCRIDDCEMQVHALGLCNKHYRRSLKAAKKQGENR